MRTTREYLQALLDGKWLRKQSCGGCTLIRMGDDKMYIKDDYPWRPYYGCPHTDWEIIDPIPEPPKPVSFMEALRDSVESGSMYERVGYDGSSIRHEFRFRIDDRFVNEIGQAFALTEVDLDAEWIKVEDAE